LSKYGPLTAIVCLFMLGVLLSVLADNASRSTDVRLARLNVSPTPFSGGAQSPGDRMDPPVPSRAHMAATNNLRERPSSPLAMTSKLAPRRLEGQVSAQPLKAQTSAVQPKPAQRPNMSQQPSLSFAPQQNIAAVATASPPEQRGLPPGVVYASDTDPVRILSVILSSDTLQGGDVAFARVLTTSNVAALTARIGTYQVNVPKVAPGMFALSITVPRVYLPGHHAVIVVTAIRTDGATTQRLVPIDVSY